MTVILFLASVALFMAGMVLDVITSIRARAVSLKRGKPFYGFAVVCMLLAMSYTEVEAGQMGMVKRFGRPVREAGPGLHFILPLIETMQTIAVQTRIVKPNED